MKATDQRKRGSSLDTHPLLTHYPTMRRPHPRRIEKASLLIGNLALWSTLGFGVCMGLMYG